MPGFRLFTHLGNDHLASRLILSGEPESRMKDDKHGHRESNQHSIQKVEQGLVLNDWTCPSLEQLDRTIDGSIVEVSLLAAM